MLTAYLTDHAHAVPRDYKRAERGPLQRVLSPVWIPRQRTRYLQSTPEQVGVVDALRPRTSTFLHSIRYPPPHFVLELAGLCLGWLLLLAWRRERVVRPSQIYPGYARFSIS